MKYLIVPALLSALLLGSCSTPAPEKRIDIILKNTTDEPLLFKAKMGPFGRTLKLDPGETWYGWVLKDFTGGQIQIVVAERRKKKKKKADPETD